MLVSFDQRAKFQVAAHTEASVKFWPEKEALIDLLSSAHLLSKILLNVLPGFQTFKKYMLLTGL